MRIVEIITDSYHADTIAAIAKYFEVTDFWCGSENDDGRRSFRMLVPDGARQGVVDKLQNLLGTTEGYRIVILSVDAVLPRPEDEQQEQNGQSRAVAATREELYSEITKGARLDSTFLLLTFLSTLVAAIGLAEDSVAVVVGAMLIAPLLGPNIALAFATSLGDRQLMWQALKTELAGLSLAVGLSMLIGLVWPANLASQEVMARTDVGMDGIALALASGAAAVLSLTTGLSATLVGVMVAVALLPPAVTMGMFLGSGQVGLASGAALLLAATGVRPARRQGRVSGKGRQAPDLDRAQPCQAVAGHLRHLVGRSPVDPDRSDPAAQPEARLISSRTTRGRSFSQNTKFITSIITIRNSTVMMPPAFMKSGTP